MEWSWTRLAQSLAQNRRSHGNDSCDAAPQVPAVRWGRVAGEGVGPPCGEDRGRLGFPEGSAQDPERSFKEVRPFCVCMSVGGFGLAQGELACFCSDMVKHKACPLCSPDRDGRSGRWLLSEPGWGAQSQKCSTSWRALPHLTYRVPRCWAAASAGPWNPVLSAGRYRHPQNGATGASGRAGLLCRLLLRRELLVVWPSSPVPSLPSLWPAEWTGWCRAPRWTTCTSCLWPWSGCSRSLPLMGASASASTMRFATWCGRRTDTARPSPCKSPTSWPGRQGPWLLRPERLPATWGLDHTEHNLNFHAPRNKCFHFYLWFLKTTKS